MLLRTVLALFVLIALPSAAGAVTLRDIIELSKAGLPDDVLAAVIDADRTIFTLDKDQILELRKAGVSKAVLLKMLATRREFDEPPPADERPAITTTSSVELPGVVIIGGESESARPRARGYEMRFDYPQYFYMPYPIWGTAPPGGHRPPPAPFLPPDQRGFGRFINDGWIGKP
jgi:hypothetical protein